MLFSLYIVKDSIQRLVTLKGQIKKEATPMELESYKTKFYAPAYDLASGYAEAYTTVDGDKTRANMKYKRVLRAITKIQREVTLEEFNEIIDELIEDYDPSHDDSLNIYSFNDVASETRVRFGRDLQPSLFNNAFLKDVVEQLALKKNRQITLFAPNCGNSHNFYKVNSIQDKVILMYGSEANEQEYKHSKTLMHKMAKGTIRGAKIQNDAFDIVYIFPKLRMSIDPKEMIIERRIEQRYVTDMIRYAREGGVVAITIPFYRMSKQLCSSLSKSLKNITILKSEFSDFEQMGYIHIIGQKEVTKVVREDEYKQLRSLFNPEPIKDLDGHKLNYEITLPDNFVEIEIFKGSSLDMEDIAEILNSTSIMDSVWNGQKVSKLGDTAKNPLLPFNIGQLGLVLTSGCLDGIVEENDENKNIHLIKGRVSKNTVKNETVDDDRVEVTETITNRVEINVLLPNGEFKVLA